MTATLGTWWRWVAVLEWEGGAATVMGCCGDDGRLVATSVLEITLRSHPAWSGGGRGCLGGGCGWGGALTDRQEAGWRWLGLLIVLQRGVVA